MGWLAESGRLGATLCAVLPVATPNPSNGSHGHWRLEHARKRRLRKLAALGCPTAALPVTVRLVRLSAGRLDEHDNLRSALKPIVDGCADRLGVKDNDPRIRWEYAQERVPRGTYGVRIEVISEGGG